MPDAESTPRARGKSKSGMNFADLLDRVRWEYDPKKVPDDGASPLATTERWFRDFPWDGAEND